MKTISDIRIYRSSETAEHVSFAKKSLNLAVRRIVMKLREQGFSLGDFDHLYLNFTLLRQEGTIALHEEADRYHPWFRFCDVGISQSEYDNLVTTDCTNYIYSAIEMVLLCLFSADEKTQEIIRFSLSEARKGQEMLMRFKEKRSAKGIATIYLRLMESGKYRPLLCVTNLAGNEIFRTDLPETIDLANIGEIQLSSKKVTVKPRKNAYAKNLSPLSFAIELK